MSDAGNFDGKPVFKESLGPDGNLLILILEDLRATMAIAQDSEYHPAPFSEPRQLDCTQAHGSLCPTRRAWCQLGGWHDSISIRGEHELQ